MAGRRWRRAEFFLNSLRARCSRGAPCRFLLGSRVEGLMDRAALHSPQAIDLGAERPFDVGGATIDPLAHEAQVNGQRERLQPQNLKVLIALVRARGRVLTRDQIVELCWDGRFIGDDVINRAISTLRQFAERAGGFTIETIPRAGYRLVEQGRQGAARLSPFWLVGSAAILLASAATVLLTPWSRPHPPPPPTIALLPFTTADPDPKIRGLAAAT